MSNQLQAPYPDATGATNLYALMWNKNNGTQVVDATGSLVTYVDASRNSYKIAVAEIVAGSRRYAGSVPANTPAGVYVVEFSIQAGGSAAGSDDVFYADDLFPWSGSAVALPVTLAVPAEAAGRPSTLEAMIRRIFEWGSNKKTRDRGTGSKRLYGADGTTVLETQTQSTATNVDQESQGA